MDLLVKILEIIGAFAFAVSGCTVAIHKKMDLFGLCALGVTTAVGGGVVRDLLLGATPPAMFTDPSCTLAALLTCLILCIPAVRGLVTRSVKLLLIADSLGLGIFTVSGTLKALLLFPNIPFLAVFVGMITGVGGGVLRDVFASEKPYIFVKHIYALASVAGSVLFILLTRFVSTNTAIIAASTFIFILRCFAAHYRWELPKFSDPD